jgi:AcrR family transcriptional regulator
VTTAGRTWRKRKRERPDEIRVAAMIEFSRLGAGAVTMEKIASRAGVTKGTLYLYYASKRALLEAARAAADPNGVAS